MNLALRKSFSLFATTLIMTQSCAIAQPLFPVGLQEHVSLPTAGSVTLMPQQNPESPVQIKSGLKEYDSTPLNGRMPIVLIHGIGGADGRLFHWDNFLSFADKSAAFKQRYKIYLYHYDSTRSVPTISRDLQWFLTNLIQQNNNTNIKVLAYSEGGLLVRNAMQDPYLDKHAAEVITIATPFHGSPLANQDWLQQQTAKDSPFSIVRMSQKIAYRITGMMYPTFKQDFHWDNFDGAIPAEQYLKSNFKPGPDKYALAEKKNFVTYGSYFGLEVDPAFIPKELGLKTAPPKERKMASNLFRKNFLFSLIRNNIGRMPLACKLAHKGEAKALASAEKKAEVTLSSAAAAEKNAVAVSRNTIASKPAASADAVVMAASATPMTVAVLSSTRQAVSPIEEIHLGADVPRLQTNLKAQGSVPELDDVSMMMFNDGISPISSTLWLGRYLPPQTGVILPVAQLWDTLRALKGNRNTRLFAGLDHRNWMSGSTRTGEATVQDLLNPDEKPRTVFQWILDDLMS